MTKRLTSEGGSEVWLLQLWRSAPRYPCRLVEHNPCGLLFNGKKPKNVPSSVDVLCGSTCDGKCVHTVSCRDA